MTRGLVLLRHGRTAWNESGRAQGHADVPLDDVGRAQAEAAAPYLASVGAAHLWSSDLLRAMETAEIVGRVAGLPVKTDARLREYDVGERQGLTVAEARERFPALVVPGEESYDDVAARIVPALREALESLDDGETGLVVSHGACLKVALAGLLGWTRLDVDALVHLDNCHLAILEERPHDGRLRLRGYGVPPISRT
jgi:broad specificity phosphatase PhoE